MRQQVKSSYRCKKNEKICLQIADQGIGIADDEKEKVFERLYRIDQSRSSEVNGSGIGLSIVKALVTKYQGTIQIEDNQPKGTIFMITFPKKNEEIFIRFMFFFDFFK